jgi:hypothetical protein
LELALLLLPPPPPQPYHKKRRRNQKAKIHTTVPFSISLYTILPEEEEEDIS